MTTLLGKEPVTIQRRSGSYVDADFVVSSDTTFAAELALQPAGGRAIERLPEGARFGEIWMSWAEPEQAELRTTETPTQLPDVVIRADGRRYEVHAYGDWTPHVTGLPHRTYLLVRIAPDE